MLSLKKFDIFYAYSRVTLPSGAAGEKSILKEGTLPAGFAIKFCCP
jgi:hypothetical protein